MRNRYAGVATVWVDIPKAARVPVEVSAVFPATGAGIRDVFNLLVDSWPPGVVPTQTLNVYSAHVTLV